MKRGHPYVCYITKCNTGQCCVREIIVVDGQQQLVLLLEIKSNILLLLFFSFLFDHENEKLSFHSTPLQYKNDLLKKIASVQSFKCPLRLAAY